MPNQLKTNKPIPSRRSPLLYAQIFPGVPCMWNHSEPAILLPLSKWDHLQPGDAVGQADVDAQSDAGADCY